MSTAFTARIQRCVLMLCTSVCACVCVRTCMCVHAFTHVHACTHTHMHVSVHLHVCVCVEPEEQCWNICTCVAGGVHGWWLFIACWDWESLAACCSSPSRFSAPYPGAFVARLSCPSVSVTGLHATTDPKSSFFSILNRTDLSILSSSLQTTGLLTFTPWKRQIFFQGRRRTDLRGVSSISQPWTRRLNVTWRFGLCSRQSRVFWV